MSGVYPAPEVLLEISRVTKRSIHWLLTGEGDANTDPLALLPDQVRSLVEEIAKQSNKSDEEMIVKLIEEALVTRGAEIMKRYPTLEPKELELMAMYFRLFDLEDSAISSESSLKRKHAR